MFRKKLWQGLTYLFAFFLTLALVVGNVMEAFSSYVDGFFGTQSTKFVTTEGET